MSTKTESKPVAKTALRDELRAAMDSIPEGPFWTTYGELCAAIGRPRSNGLAIASAAATIDGFMRWDQIRNADGIFNPMTDADGQRTGRVSTDPTGRKVVVHDAATIAGWAKRRGLKVSDSGRADKSQKITFRDGRWVGADGKPVTAKVRKARAPRAPKPETVAPEATEPVVEPVVETVPAEAV